MLLFASVATGQNSIAPKSEISFSKYSNRDGLSQPNVSSIAQDNDGFIWIGTTDGLNKFDGYQFTTFRNIPNDSRSMPNNRVSCIFKDSKGRFWVAFNKYGIREYIVDENVFIPVMARNSEIEIGNVSAVDEDSKGNIWFASRDYGMFKYDLRSNEIIHFSGEFDDPALFSEIQPNVSLYTGRTDYVWYSVSNGMMTCYNVRTDEIKRIDLPIKEKKSCSIHQINQGRGDSLLLSTSMGVFSYSIKTNKFRHSIKKNKSDRFIITNCSLLDSRGNLWFGTESDGLIFISQKGEYRNIKQNDLVKNSISENDVRTVFEDSFGNIWVGTLQGLDYFDPNTSIFNHYIHIPEDPNSLSDNDVKCFMEINDKLVCVGTDAGGVNIMNKETGTFLNIHASEKPYSLNDNSILALMDDENSVWIGTYNGGLNYFDKKSFHFSNYRYHSEKVWQAEDAIYSIFKYDKKTLWLGSNGAGILVFDKIKRKFTRKYLRNTKDPRSLLDNYIRKIFRDKEGNVWIGSYGGLNKYDPDNDRFINFNDRREPLKADIILDIFEDDAGRLWFGSYGDGLIFMNRQKETFRYFKEEDGLSSNIIYGILQGNNPDELWISTSNGLNQVIIHDDGDISILVRHFYQEDGLQNDDFSVGASYKDSQGNLYFGGHNGFNFFNPDDIKYISAEDYKIALSSIKLMNADQNVEDLAQSLNKAIDKVDEIEISYQNYSITFEFLALNYSLARRIKYAYRLEGFEEKWNYSEKNRRAIYTNLPVGKYKFRIKATTDGVNWIERDKALTLIIDGPWYKTWTGRAVMIIGGILFALILFWANTLRLKGQQKLLETLVKEKNKEISLRNTELRTQNQELLSQNEEIIIQKEMINEQNTLLKEAQDKLKEVNASLEDVVEDRTRKLNQTIIQLNKSIKELDSFVYSASHDLSSPLKSIMGLINIARLDRDPEKMEEHLYYIEKSVVRLNGVIKKLSEFSWSGRVESTYDKIPLRSFVEELFEEQKFMKEVQDVEVYNRISESLILIQDKLRLKIILSNLITNAIKYRDEGKLKCFVRIEAEEENDCWKIYIIDNGIGIEKEFQEKIFDMFFRASEMSEGSGLGLYIVRESLQKINGKIHINSTIGKGTTFIIEIPKNGR